jgi:hypothetical protein
MADENEKKVRLEEKSGCGTPLPMVRSTREMICRETMHACFTRSTNIFHTSRKLPTNKDDIMP